MAYRSDIDGLRAVAVLAVVLYHAGLPGFAGGFVGVDVFFVISGYLITAIVLADLERQRFSLLAFYERRVRRIFPALFAMLAATTVAGSIVYLPRELDELGGSIVAATLFVSNVLFWQTSDYFAGAAHLKPLLHTWSLSVEEQFYLAFPLAMWAIWHGQGRRWLCWLLPVLIASLALAIWGTGAKPQATFYLLPTRAWELLLGALLALGRVPAIRQRVLAEAAGLAGLGLIVGATVLYSEATPFPGAAALAPCVGAALLIWSGTAHRTLAGRLLSLGPMRLIGLVSYSLYLWHWPILVFARHMAGGTLTAGETGAALALSLVAALASWRFIEMPFRHAGPAGRWPQRRLLAAAAAVMLAAVGLGASLTASNGWASRFPDYQPPVIPGREAMREGSCFLTPEQPPARHKGAPNCLIGDADGQRIVLWGDSFAAHLVPGLDAAPLAGKRILQLNASGCPPVAGVNVPGRPHCRAFNDAALATIAAERPAVVVLAARWEAHLGRRLTLADLQGSVDHLRRGGSAVIVVAQGPSFDFDSPYDHAYRANGDTARMSTPPAVNRHLAAIRHARIFDPVPLLCDAGSCPLKDGAQFLYFDGGHLSSAGSRILAAPLLRLIDEALAERAASVSVSRGPDTN